LRSRVTLLWTCRAVRAEAVRVREIANPMKEPGPEDLDEFVAKVQQIFLEEAEKLYGQKVVELWRNPKNHMPLSNPDGRARHTGPCGDTMEIFVEVRDHRIIRATFLTDGCAPSLASGSAVTELAKGRAAEEVLKIDQKAVLDALGGLPEESEHCAKLAADALRMAVEDYLARARDPGGSPPDARPC
jgi:nitrogen fixation NifU-like protein